MPQALVLQQQRKKAIDRDNRAVYKAEQAILTIYRQNLVYGFMFNTSQVDSQHHSTPS